MASRRLTKALKQEIKDELTFVVQKKMVESIPGKELIVIQKKLVNFLMKEMSKEFTQDELQVLMKWGYTRKGLSFSLGKTKFVDQKTREESFVLTSPWNNYHIQYMRLDFPKDFITPKDSSFKPDYNRQRLTDNPKMLTLTLEGITIFNHICCETKATVDAYMEIVDKFTTEKKLIDAYPNMAKYMPEDEREPVTPVSKKAKTLISSFEDI